MGQTPPEPVSPTVQYQSGCKDPFNDGQSSKRETVCQLVSKFRASYGLGPVALSLNLNYAAQLHAQDMLSKGYFSHDSPDGRDAGDRIRAFTASFKTWGENIADGYSSAEDVFDGWINSPGHRATILQPAFKYMGIGLAGDVWVQDFSG
jgi:uncharacterized protein YkwD